jgi:fumarate reductase subunit D
VVTFVTVPTLPVRCPINLCGFSTNMDTKGNSPSNIATFTRKWIRRVCVFVLLLLFLITTAARVRSYLMVRKIQAVLHGLSDVRVDQTTEEQLTKSVPYLSKITWFQGSRTTYRFEISTENDPRTLALAAY